jgi:hypothetical protein
VLGRGLVASEILLMAAWWRVCDAPLVERLGSGVKIMSEDKKGTLLFWGVMVIVAIIGIYAASHAESGLVVGDSSSIGWMK